MLALAEMLVVIVLSETIS